SCYGKALISSLASPPRRKFLNTGLNICDCRIARRKRRCFSMITASEKKDSATRQIITAPPNRPTFPNNSLKVIVSSCDSSRISTHSLSRQMAAPVVLTRQGSTTRPRGSRHPTKRGLLPLYENDHAYD